MRRVACTFLALGLSLGAPGVGAAFVPTVPDATTVLTDRSTSRSSHLVPVSGFDGTAIPGVRATGVLSRTVFRTPGRVASTLDLLAEMRAQVEAAGFEVIFQCDTDTCGGFDFRFGIDVVGEPEMHVDLGDFRFLSARRDREDGSPDYLMVLVSRSAEFGYVQVANVAELPEAEVPAAAAVVSTKTPDAAADLPLEGALRAYGSAVLEGVTFVSGAGDITAGEDDLAELAGWLNDDPSRKVMLVGHTDAVGSLDGNIKLSRARARSVRSYLIEHFGVNPDQVGAEGVGFLSPRATNETEEGRARNRRVEVVLTPAE